MLAGHVPVDECRERAIGSLGHRGNCQVAASALAALEQGRLEAAVDDFSRAIKADLHDDQNRNLHDDQNLIYPAIADRFNAAAVR